MQNCYLFSNTIVPSSPWIHTPSVNLHPQETFLMELKIDFKSSISVVTLSLSVLQHTTIYCVWPPWPWQNRHSHSVNIPGIMTFRKSNYFTSTNWWLRIGMSMWKIGKELACGNKMNSWVSQEMNEGVSERVDEWKELVKEQCLKPMVAQLRLTTKTWPRPVKFDPGQVKIRINYIRCFFLISEWLSENFCLDHCKSEQSSE